jgi:hypothetical protein
VGLPWRGLLKNEFIKVILPYLRGNINLSGQIGGAMFCFEKGCLKNMVIWVNRAFLLWNE